MATAKKTPAKKAAPKKPAAAASASVASQIAALEARISKLEEQSITHCLQEMHCPTQEQLRGWIKANPFLALALAVVAGIIFAVIF